MKVLITSVPFGNIDSLPLEILESAGADFTINPLNKKLSEDELADLIGEYEIVIAGTEPYSKKVLEKASNLKMISRMGIGLDGVDLNEAKKRGIRVSYTPDAPAPSIAELTLGFIITLLRSVHQSNIEMHKGIWQRYIGRTIDETSIGFIGVGRIGAKVIEMLSAFGDPKLLVNDISPNHELTKKYNLEWVDKEKIYRESDLISLHVPLTSKTKNMISRDQLLMMKSDASLINTCRGGIINEDDLYDVMKSGHLNGAAIDVFENEPYAGKLLELDNCLLTPHMGSMSNKCRSLMEIESTKEAVRYIKGETLKGEVPEIEYDIQKMF